eukprot:204556_1
MNGFIPKLFTNSFISCALSNNKKSFNESTPFCCSADSTLSFNPCSLSHVGIGGSLGLSLLPSTSPSTGAVLSTKHCAMVQTKCKFIDQRNQVQAQNNHGRTSSRIKCSWRSTSIMSRMYDNYIAM